MLCDGYIPDNEIELQLFCEEREVLDAISICIVQNRKHRATRRWFLIFSTHLKLSVYGTILNKDESKPIFFRELDCGLFTQSHRSEDLFATVNGNLS